MIRIVGPRTVVATLSLLVTLPAYAAAEAVHSTGQGQSGPHATATGQAKEGRAARSISGKIGAVDQRALTFTNGEQVRLTKHTSFVQGGQSIQRVELKPGESVRASYQPRGKLAYATQVQVVKGSTMAKAPTSARKSQGASSGPSGAK